MVRVAQPRAPADERDDRELLVELVDPVRTPAAPGSPGFGDPVGSERPPTLTAAALQRWPWWRRADRFARVVATATAVVAVVAAGVGVLAARASHPERLRTIVVTDAAPDGPPDALGCPAARSCAVRDPAGLRSALHAVRPDLGVVSAFETYDRDTGRVYRRQFLARSPRTSMLIRMASACTASEVDVAPSATFLTRRSFESDRMTRVEMSWQGGSDPGCSTTLHATLVVRTADAAFVDDRVLVQLGLDPDIEVRR
ncbi:MAG: hypothetical protein ABJA87_11290 [bacterium]